MSRKRVIRLMQEEGLKARVRKRFKGTTMSDHDQPVAARRERQRPTARAQSALMISTTGMTAPHAMEGRCRQLG